MSGPDALPEEQAPRKGLGCWKKVGIAALLLAALAGIVFYAFALPTIRHVYAQTNVYYMCGFACELYAKEHNGRYPPLSSQPGKLMVDAETLYPEYMEDYEAWTYPGDPMPGTAEEREQNPAILVDDHSYFYLGYVILDEREARAFAEGYKKRIAEGGDFTDDLNVPPGQGNAGSDTIFRLRKGVEHVIAGLAGRDDDGYAEELAARIPVIFQRPDSGRRRLVVYTLDRSHMADPPPRMGRFPYTPEMVDILLELDALGQ